MAGLLLERETMNRNTPFILWSALAFGLLVAIVGFRFSFVSADVSAIARDLGEAKVRIVELEAALRESRSQHSGSAARTGTADFDQFLATGTPRAKVLQHLGGPVKGFGVRAVETTKASVPYRWVCDDGSDAAVRIDRHLPTQFQPPPGLYTSLDEFSDSVAVRAWEWDGFLVFFDRNEQVVFWCRPGK
jgi:hypothetical protein